MGNYIAIYSVKPRPMYCVCEDLFASTLILSFSMGYQKISIKNVALAMGEK